MMGALFLRSIAGGIIPLAGNPMFASMAVGWGCLLLSLIAAIMCFLSAVSIYVARKRLVTLKGSGV
jgi:hypothetical protein